MSGEAMVPPVLPPHFEAVPKPGRYRRSDAAPRAKGSVEGAVQVVIMLAIGTAAGAGSFTHVHDVAAAHGQAGWLAWADAVVLELMSIASGLELRRRKRAHEGTRFPAIVMGASVVLSLGAQVVEAERSVIGWIAAAIPALGFLVMVKIALARAGTTTSEAPGNFEVEAGAQEPATGETGLVPEQKGVGETVSKGSEVDRVVEVLIPAARAAAATLHQQKRRVTRKALADVLRADGYGVSNARASELLRELKPELGGKVSPTGLLGVVPSNSNPDSKSSGDELSDPGRAESP